jgi:hypothetical protein
MVLTTEVYFDELTSGAAYARAPYEPGRDQINAAHAVFDQRALRPERGAGWILAKTSLACARDVPRHRGAGAHAGS